MLILVNAYDMRTAMSEVMERMTILLDRESRKAARQIALALDCSVPQAIRHAIVSYRDQLAVVSAKERARRTASLGRAFAAFAGVDPAAEVRRIQREDRGF